MGKMIVFDIRFSPSVSYSHSNEAQTRARARDDMPTCRILHSRGLQPAFASFERLVRRLPWMQRELLNSPIRDLAHEDFVFRYLFMEPPKTVRFFAVFLFSLAVCSRLYTNVQRPCQKIAVEIRGQGSGRCPGPPDPDHASGNGRFSGSLRF